VVLVLARTGAYAISDQRSFIADKAFFAEVFGAEVAAATAEELNI
jgi:hypothetical protein